MGIILGMGKFIDGFDGKIQANIKTKPKVKQLVSIMKFMEVPLCTNSCTCISL